MAHPPITRPSLLVRLRDARDTEAWGQFVQLYAPLVYEFARKRGLQDADAADVTQEVLRAVARSACRLQYDPRRGSFHAWLLTVALHKVQDFWSSRRRHGQGSGDAGVQVLLEEQTAPEPEEAAWWDQEYQRQLLAVAVEQVRAECHASTWQAFWQTAMEGKKPREVAAALGMSVAAVYMAKSRVLSQLKRQIQQLQEA
jgi:RNA polymerase sigma-70 factor (ECF subfamily)